MITFPKKRYYFSSKSEYSHSTSIHFPRNGFSPPPKHVNLRTFHWLSRVAFTHFLSSNPPGCQNWRGGGAGVGQANFQILRAPVLSICPSLHPFKLGRISDMRVFETCKPVYIYENLRKVFYPKNYLGPFHTYSAYVTLKDFASHHQRFYTDISVTFCYFDRDFKVSDFICIYFHTSTHTHH